MIRMIQIQPRNRTTKRRRLGTNKYELNNCDRIVTRENILLKLYMMNSSCMCVAIYFIMMRSKYMCIHVCLKHVKKFLRFHFSWSWQCFAGLQFCQEELNGNMVLIMVTWAEQRESKVYYHWKL